MSRNLKGTDVRVFRRRLSPRQAELLGLVEQGCSQDEAASAMGISINTVKKHTKVLLRKANCESTREMVFAGLCRPGRGSQKGAKGAKGGKG